MTDWLTENAQPKLLVVESEREIWHVYYLGRVSPVLVLTKKGFLEISPLGEENGIHTGNEFHADEVGGES